MKKAHIFFFSLIILLLRSYAVWAIPVDLGSFTADKGVTVENNVITFTEDEDYRTIYFYDDNFFVEKNASVLSYHYYLTQSSGNSDWLVAIIDDGFDYEYKMLIGENRTGLWAIDMTQYQGKTVSLSFGLESDDFETGTVGAVYDISMDPVPEPASVILLISGFVCLAGIRIGKRIKMNR